MLLPSRLRNPLLRRPPHLFVFLLLPYAPRAVTEHAPVMAPGVRGFERGGVLMLV